MFSRREGSFGPEVVQEGFRECVGEGLDLGGLRASDNGEGDSMAGGGSDVKSKELCW